MDPEVVPNFEMRFQSLEHAFLFYRKYAWLAGFPVKKNRKRGTDGKDFCCSLEGKHNTKVEDGDRKTSKTSKCDGSKAKQWCAQGKREMEGVSFLHALFSNITTS